MSDLRTAECGRVDLIVMADDGFSDLEWAARTKQHLLEGRRVLAVEERTEYSMGVVGIGDGLSHYAYYRLDDYPGFEQIAFERMGGFSAHEVLEGMAPGDVVAWNGDLSRAGMSTEEVGRVHRAFQEAGMHQVLTAYGCWGVTEELAHLKRMCLELKVTSVSWLGDRMAFGEGRDANEGIRNFKGTRSGRANRWTWNVLDTDGCRSRKLDYGWRKRWGEALHMVNGSYVDGA